MVLLILGSEKITLIYQNFENDGSAVNIFDQRDIEKKIRPIFDQCTEVRFANFLSGGFISHRKGNW